MRSPPRILVFQHIDIEHPGIFRDFLRADGIDWTPVELDEGEPIPALADYDALWVMGGPMDVWEEAAHPWLVPEKAAIREAVAARRMPYLGLCLGHQLLAEALGGAVGPAATPEIGILEVELTEAGRASPFYRAMPDLGTCLQWHSAEVTRAPADAEVLASTAACAVQALSYGSQAFSIQYHLEMTDRTVPEWGEVPAYRAALEKALGPGALPGFMAEAESRLPDFKRDARQLYENFMAQLHN